ncbi:MAG TPA: hypothetical protein PLC39_02850 [Methanomassiliicoccales archaeon]|nr:hypothetical protein [Methanomassiliicoccales archaeon]
MVDLVDELSTMWDDFLLAVPAILAAIIVLIIGLLVAWVAGKIIKMVVRKVGLERFFNQTATGRAFLSSGLYASNLASMLVMAFVMIFFIVLSIQVLDMSGIFGDYLTGLANYLPKVFVGVLVLVLGAFFADFLSSFIGRIVRPMFPEGKQNIAEMLKNLLFIGLIAFVVLLALNVMLLTGALVYTLVLGFVIIGVGILLTDALIKSVADEHPDFKEVAGYAKFVLYAIFLIIGTGAIFATFPGVTSIIANISWAFAIAMALMLVPVAFAMTKKMAKP